MKVHLCQQVYKLLAGICQLNQTNGLIVFELIPFFQIHCKFIPEAIDCLIQICSRNETILNRLSEDLRIEYNYQDKKAVQIDQRSTIKFLINLYQVDKIII